MLFGPRRTATCNGNISISDLIGGLNCSPGNNDAVGGGVPKLCCQDKGIGSGGGGVELWKER